MTPSNVFHFILSKLLIMLMEFPWLGAAFHTQSTNECTKLKLSDVCHIWYVASQCRSLNSGDLKG